MHEHVAAEAPVCPSSPPQHQPSCVARSSDESWEEDEAPAGKRSSKILLDAMQSGVVEWRLWLLVLGLTVGG